MSPDAWQIKKSKGKGRGVFSTRTHKAGALVLSHEVLPVPNNEVTSFLDNYIFHCGGIYFICLGAGSLLNHSETPKLWFSYNKKISKIEFFASENIKKGDELTIDYEWPFYPWEKAPLDNNL